DLSGAIAHYRQALEISPGSVDAMNNLAWILATQSDASARNGPEAVRLAEKACELTGRLRALLLGTLAAAYAEAGRYPDAARTAQEACDRATQDGDKILAQKNGELLRLYRENKPYHEPGSPAPN